MKECKDGCSINYNEGISCMVQNCQYHNGECHCSAKEISVGPSHANTSADTICSTFKPRA